MTSLQVQVRIWGWRTVSTEASRRLSSILACLRFESWNKLAGWLGSSREHLLGVRGGRTGIGHSLAGRLASVLHVRGDWMLFGRLPVFFRGLEPDPDGAVERAILGQLQRSVFVGQAVPVFGTLDDVADEPREVPVDPIDPDDLRTRGDLLGARVQIPFAWRTYEVRPTSLPAAVAKEAFFLLLDKKLATIIGASEGDAVLFLRAKCFFGNHSPGKGDLLICTVESGRGKTLHRMRVTEIEPAERTSPDQRETKPRARSITCDDTAGSRYNLAAESPRSLPQKPRLHAVALRLERLLLVRENRAQET